MERKGLPSAMAGYALAGAGAAVTYAAGGPGWIALVLFWVGGAALTLTFALLPSVTPTHADRPVPRAPTVKQEGL